MVQKYRGIFSLTRMKMHGYIRAGRNAIEYAMLLILVRPRVLNAEDEAEMAELKALLKMYNELMAKYEMPRIDSIRADEKTLGRGDSK